MAPLRRVQIVWNAMRARLAAVGADPRDDEPTKQSKALLVLISVLILPIAVVWGSLYLLFGSWVGYVPFLYAFVLLGAIVAFALTQNLTLLVRVNQLDILLAPTLSMIPLGGFLPSAGVGMWAVLAPVGALVFSGPRAGLRWFLAYLTVFIASGVAGQIVGPVSAVPEWFTSTMLGLNVAVGGSFVFVLLTERHDAEKIRSIGDNFMCVTGVPRRRADHAQAMARLALDMRAYLDELRAAGEDRIDLRFGMNSGPCVGGVIGLRKFVFDIWGDPVNTASRMESHSVPGRIHLSDATYQLIQDEFECEPRGTIEVKGKGPMQTWFLVCERVAHAESARPRHHA